MEGRVGRCSLLDYAYRAVGRTVTDTVTAPGVPGFGVQVNFADQRLTVVEPFNRRMTMWFSAADEPRRRAPAVRSYGCGRW
jgi:hypothetical protein